MATQVRVFVNRREMLKALEEKGWSQAELARQLDVRKSTVSRMMSGDRTIGLTIYRLLQEMFPGRPEIFVEHREVIVRTTLSTASGSR